jgi:hypothetical protein
MPTRQQRAWPTFFKPLAASVNRHRITRSRTSRNERSVAITGKPPAAYSRLTAFTISPGSFAAATSAKQGANDIDKMNAELPGILRGLIENRENEVVEFRQANNDFKLSDVGKYCPAITTQKGKCFYG